MKQGKSKSEETVRVSKKDLLALVAAKIKGRELFPKKVEETNRFLERAQVKSS